MFRRKWLSARPASARRRRCPAMQVLAVPSDDNSIKCYDSRTGAAVRELQAHEDAVQAVAFDGEGRFMVSGGSDNTFKLWS